MKNLKKVLALVLAMASVFSMGISASAVASDFSDYDEIQNKEAVEVMNALKVIDGYNTGDFKPEGYLTRAEMCKMVAYVMNGGTDPVLSSSNTYTYTDISSSWAKDYIEYASDMGIVSGVGYGKFDPQGTLTGVQAAKMMLTAMGYNANVFGFTGSGWDVSVNRYANEAGLYEGLEDMQPNLPITRDQAAQLMYNAIQATMMKRTWTQNPATGEITEAYQPWTEFDGGTEYDVNLLRDKFGATIKASYLSGYDYDSVKDEWTYDFVSTAAFGGKAIKNGLTGSRESDVDYTDMFGQQVKVIYSIDGDAVYGVYTNDSSVIATAATGEINGYVDTTSKSVEINGTKYKVDSAAMPVYDVRNDTAIAGMDLDDMKDDDSAFTFKLVDNTGDGKADVVIRTPLTVAKITYVGSETITLNEQVDSSAVQTIEDINIYDGFAKDDWVYITEDQYAVTDAHTFEKVEMKSATVTGVRDSAGSYYEYQLDGKWYTIGNAPNTNVDDMEVGDTVNYVACGARLYFAEITDLGATTKNLAVVITTALNGEDGDQDIDTNVAKAKLLFADGTKKTVTIDKVGTVENGKNGATMSSVRTAADALIGKMVTYRVDGDGNYELTAVSTTNTAGYKDFAGTVNGYDDSTIGGVDLAKDAIVFVWDDDHTVGTPTDFAAANTNDGAVYTGSEFINQFGDSTWGQNALSQILTSNVGGYTYVKVAVIVNDLGEDLPEITAGSNYGYLTENSYRSYEDGKTYLNFTLYTANGVLTAKQENTEDPSLYTKGNVITYDVVSDGIIKNVSEIDMADGLTLGVVSGVGVSKVQIATDLDDVKASNSSYTVNDDTSIIFVDSKNCKGAEGGSIEIGQLYDDGAKAYKFNVRYLLNESGDTVVLIIVDVNSDYGNSKDGITNESADGTAAVMRPGVE